MNGMMQAAFMFLMITFLMIAELGLNYFITQDTMVSSSLVEIIKNLIEQGIIVVLAGPLLSILFGKLIRMNDLDISRVYNESVIKIYYSLVVFVNCLMLLKFASLENNANIYVNNIYFNRIIMWGLSIFGTWFGIGFGCKGRINETEENERRSKRKISKKEIGQYWIPLIVILIIMIIGYLLICATDEAAYMTILSIYWYLGYIVLCIGITMIVYARINKPSKRKSDKKLVKAIQLVSDNESCIEGKYRYLNYLLFNEDGKKELVIKARNVVWEENEDRVREKLGEKRIPVQAFDYGECRDLLRKTVKEQTNFIREGFEECKDIAERKMRM